MVQLICDFSLLLSSCIVAWTSFCLSYVFPFSTSVSRDDGTSHLHLVYFVSLFSINVSRDDRTSHLHRLFCMTFSAF